jgi:ATP-dependent Clp protease ATP-binding subunit ClpC
MLAKKYIKNISSPKNILNILDIAGAYTEVGNDIPEDIVDYDKKIFDLRQSQILFEMVKEKMIDSMPDKKRWNKTMEKKLDKYSKAYEKRVKEYGETIEIKDVTEEAIKESVSELADIPFDKIENNDSEKVKSVISNMKKDIVGQDMAIDMIGKVLKRRSVGIKSNKKPIGVFLFLGQTGVGKTFIAKRLSYYMFGDESNMIRLDMSEYSTPESVNKLIGASAGYVGYNEGGVLTEAVKKSKYCIVLLDEIEKASKEVFNMFLQIFDDGRISDNKGTLVDFSNTLIIMTSNVGARRAAENGLSVGFTKNDNAKQEVVDKELKKTFAPEFLNRIDHIVQFNPLDDNAIYRITKNQLDDLKNTLKDNGIDISYDDDVVKFISAKSIKDKNYTNIDMGARPINRNIQTMVEDLIADYIIENSISVCNLSIYIENNNIKIKSNE